MLIFYLHSEIRKLLVFSFDAGMPPYKGKMVGHRLHTLVRKAKGVSWHGEPKERHKTSSGTAMTSTRRKDLPPLPFRRR